MSPHPENKRPFDISEMRRKVPHIKRQQLDRDTSEKKREIPTEFPFEWPETHKRECELEEHTVDKKGNPIRIKERKYSKGEEIPIDIEEIHTPDFEELIKEPTKWEPIPDMPLQHLKDPEGREYHFPSFTHSAIAADRGAGTFLLVTPNGITRVLKHPTKKRLMLPRVGPDGTLLTLDRESNTCIRTPDGVTTTLQSPKNQEIEHPIVGKNGTFIGSFEKKYLILRKGKGETILIKDPEEKRLFPRWFTEDGTILAEREDHTILIRTPDGIITILEDPEGEKLLNPSLALDGTLAVERGRGAILLHTLDRLTTILQDPEEALRFPSLAPDGTLFAFRANSNAFLVRHPSRIATIIEVPGGTRDNNPTITPNGALIVQRRDDSLIRALPRQQSILNPASPAPPRRAF